MSEPAKPALSTALEMQQRAAAVGFDWPDAQGPRAKIVEELAELDYAVRHDRASENPQSVKEELGDLLFAAVNYARHLGVEPEQALVAANEKFRRRFHYIEERLADEGLHPVSASLEKMDTLWNEAKRNL
ncbi:MAG: MazG nucleotide pyrophosphohydrolase domain-containing protein [Gammaproteobacteria bacterium]